ncbi:MAG: leucine-rich repeat domain-containing protein [Acutalibacteraceae bacterium]|nr:leucine-rich repeat domain-containing protein [Acutalibacteraceae bacterium]
MSKKEKKIQVEEPVHLDIPEDEIWTYQVEGLAPPHINKPYKHFGIKKVVFAIIIIIAVSLSCYFSVRTVQKDTYEYKQTQTGYELSKFSNTGYITALDIDYVSSVEYDSENPDVNTNYIIVKDETKKVTSVGSYALNCDERVQVINIGADVEFVDPKAFYSCWALRQIEVDENNPNYCDVDGVLYSKDKTEIICRPCDHDTYLAEKYGHAKYDENGYRMEPSPEDADYEQYVNDVLTFVVPSSVKTIGQLCFNYANMKNVYIPEGVTVIETLGFFEIPLLENIYSYKPAADVTESHFVSQEALGKVYNSLPEGLEYIGSDAFSYNQAMNYVYIPESVTHIGHHAFWDTVYKEGDELKGVSVINVARSEEDFKDAVETGDSWRPQYDYMLFKKSIDIAYGAERVK